MATNVFVNLSAASRLIGLNLAVVSKRASQGKYGPTRLSPAGEVLVSTHGLALAGRRYITDQQIAAAKAGKPLPPASYDSTEIWPLRRRTIDEIGASVARTIHQSEQE